MEHAPPPPLKSPWAQIVRGPGTAQEQSGAQAGSKVPPAEARRPAPVPEQQHNIRADYAKPAAVRVQAVAREEARGPSRSSDGPPGAASAASPRGVVPPSQTAGSPVTAPSEPCSTEKEREGASVEGSGDTQASTPKHEVSRHLPPCSAPGSDEPQPHPICRCADPVLWFARRPRRPSP